MNLFYHTGFYVLFSIHIISISVCQVVSANYVLLQNRPRHKRVYEGSDVTDDQFPYVVFIKSLTSNNDSINLDRAQCKEKLCTGTLIHARYVLTLLSCVVSSEEDAKIYPHNIHIFLNTRPYNEIKENKTYLVGQQIISKRSDKSRALKFDNVALIFMNGSFSEVKTFPKVMEVDPFVEGSTLSCTTVGYSLIGRNLSRPVNEEIKPRTYNFDAVMNIPNCTNDSVRKSEKDVYMCYLGEPPIKHSLCKLGDEGSPLLCKRPTPTSELSRQESNETAVVTNNTDFYVYGMAHIVPDCTGVFMLDPNWTTHSKVLFIYMLKYGLWINMELSDYKETIESTESAETTSVEQSSTVSSARLTTTTVLPEYYDTDDYDAVKKHPVRCRADPYQHLALHGHGPLIAVRYRSFIPGHKSAAAHPSRSCVAVLCAALWHATVIAVRRLSI